MCLHSANTIQRFLQWGVRLWAIGLAVVPVAVVAQETHTDSLPAKFTASLEIRPRFEYTYNYKLPPNDTASPFGFLTIRNRLTTQFTQAKWLVHADFQEIHYWDKNTPGSKVASVNFYQLFGELRFKGISLRAGRQAVLLDNGRIFSDAPWAQQSRSHEGLRLMKKHGRYNHDVFLLFTRNYGTLFDAAFSPVGAHKYQYMAIYHLNMIARKTFSFNTINSVDVFKIDSSGKRYARFNIGGRVNLKTKPALFTLNSYLQFGRTPAGKKLLAYYLQPEINAKLKSTTVRIGAEILSGSSPELATGRSGDFDVLYGVAWKFMGNMNLFTRFPQDVAGKGLVNPYCFILQPLSKQFSLRSDFHLFYTQYPLRDARGLAQPKFLGYEIDASMRYTPWRAIEINFEIALCQSTPSMQFLPKVFNADKIAVWSYLMVAYNLNLAPRKTKSP